jgi:ubiquinone biosynthesis protein
LDGTRAAGTLPRKGGAAVAVAPHGGGEKRPSASVGTRRPGDAPLGGNDRTPTAPGYHAPVHPGPESARAATAAPVRHRLLYAYALTVRVLLSYGGVAAVGWVRGQAWKERALLTCHMRSARRVMRGIVRLQGLFVKVGQLISMLTSFLPAEFRDELEALQDRVPPRPAGEVAARLREELGKLPEELFAAWEPQPLASASLAQVHAATLADGRRVAVKVQHLGIETTARRDLATVRRIFRLVSLFVRVRGLHGVHRDLAAMIDEELDFAREARNLAAIAAAFGDDATVAFPTVVDELSTTRVLTTTFVDGVKVSHVDELEAAGHDRGGVAATVLAAYCRMIFEHGVYHADPHPGNLFVRADGAVAFVDFGAVGRLSPAMREGIPDFFAAVLGQDPARILTALRRMGFVARGGDERAAERVIGYLHRRFLEQLTLESWNLQDIHVDARMKLETLADLRRLGVSLRDLMAIFEVPRDWVLLERTLLLLVGLCTHLAPQMNPMTTIRPYLERLLLGRDREWPAVVGAALKDLALSAVAVPGDLRRLLARAERGELEVRLAGLTEGMERLSAGLRQLLWGLFAATGAVVAFVAEGRGDERVALGAAGVGAVAITLLALSLWRSRSRPSR